MKHYFISYMLSDGACGRCSVEVDDFLRIGDIEVQLEKLLGRGKNVTVMFYKKISEIEANHLERPDHVSRRVKFDSDDEEH